MHDHRATPMRAPAHARLEENVGTRLAGQSLLVVGVFRTE